MPNRPGRGIAAGRLLAWLSLTLLVPAVTIGQQPAASNYWHGLRLPAWPFRSASTQAPTPIPQPQAGPAPQSAVGPQVESLPPQIVGGPPMAGGFHPFPGLSYPWGQYVAQPRIEHVPIYRLRVDDELEFVYRITRVATAAPYEFEVGDEVRVESIADPTLNRDLVVQPDGTITLRLLGQVRATGRTVAQLRQLLDEQYKQYYNVPAITVTPLKVNTRLEDLRQSVNSQFASGGQTRRARVTPEGTIQLPAIGSVFVQGMSLDEVNREVNYRYRQVVQGLELTTVLTARAPRFVYVVGEVRLPGRYTLEGPTSVMQAISLAGGWNVGGNLRNVLVFRRNDHWGLQATRLDVWDPLYGRTLRACDDIWLGDSDLVVVPKQDILVADEYIDLIFTRGIYGVFPLQGISINMSKMSTL